jgi:hypothetical protein
MGRVMYGRFSPTFGACLIHRKFFYRIHLIYKIESFKFSRDSFQILNSYKIYSKRLDLLNKFLCVYNNYYMYLISIEVFCVFPTVQPNDFYD